MQFLWVVLLAGCYDFEGEALRLGFTTDHMVAEGQAWTPDSPIVRGSRVTATASERLDTHDTGSALHEVGTVSAGLRLVESGENSVIFDADHGGRVWFDGDLRDSFRVREAVPTSVLVAVPGRDPEPSIAVVADAPCAVSLSLADADGRLLGYQRHDLAIEADGPVQLTFRDDVPVLTASADARLTVAILAFDPVGPEIHVVPDADVTALELTTESMAFEDGKTLVRVLGRTDDGTAVQCLPIRWSAPTEWAVGADAVVLDGNALTAEWGDLSVSL